MWTPSVGGGGTSSVFGGVLLLAAGGQGDSRLRQIWTFRENLPNASRFPTSPNPAKPGRGHMIAVAQLLHQLEDAQFALADLCGLLLLSGRPALTHSLREAGLSLGERTRLVNALHRRAGPCSGGSGRSAAPSLARAPPPPTGTRRDVGHDSASVAWWEAAGLSGTSSSFNRHLWPGEQRNRSSDPGGACAPPNATAAPHVLGGRLRTAPGGQARVEVVMQQFGAPRLSHSCCRPRSPHTHATHSASSSRLHR